VGHFSKSDVQLTCLSTQRWANSGDRVAFSPGLTYLLPEYPDFFVFICWEYLSWRGESRCCQLAGAVDSV